MTGFRVVREIHFSYGHRIPGHAGKCANLHGHNGRVQIEVSSAALDGLGMVIDFEEIKSRIGAWIAETLDHKMILSKKDPLAAVLQKAGDPVVLTEETPTAEVLARWIFEEARKRRLAVSRVTLWETPNSAAVYEG